MPEDVARKFPEGEEAPYTREQQIELMKTAPDRMERNIARWRSKVLSYLKEGKLPEGHSVKQVMLTLRDKT